MKLPTEILETLTQRADTATAAMNIIVAKRRVIRDKIRALRIPASAADINARALWDQWVPAQIAHLNRELMQLEIELESASAHVLKHRRKAIAAKNLVRKERDAQLDSIRKKPTRHVPVQRSARQ